MYKFCFSLLIPLFLFLLVLYPFSIGLNYSKGLLLLTLVIVIISVILFVFSTFFDPIVELRKQYIRPIFLFLLGYLIVFFQGYTDLLLGNLLATDLFYFVKPHLINQAALLSCAGLIALFLGYFIRLKPIKKKYKVFSVIPLDRLIIVFTLFNLLSIYLNLKTFLSGEYSQELIESNSGTSSSYAQLLFYITYLSIIILHAINCRLKGANSIIQFVKGLGWLFYVNLGVYLLLIIISGDRGPILTISLTFICAATVGTLVRIKLKYILMCVFGGALFITLLGIVRRMDTKVSLSNRLVEAFSENKISEKYESFSPVTAELASSVRTLHFVIDKVPNDYPYLFGLLQLRESLKTIPFAAGIFDPLFPSHFRYINSAFYITWLDKGNFYFVGSGSSINADLYLIFGEISVLLGLFLVGRLFRRLDVLVFTSDRKFISLYSIVLSISILGSSIFWSRATYLAPIKSIAFTYIMVYLYLGFINRKKKAF
ncbi:hypothetical protein M2306_001541 [Myroides gitamensis]|uniref:Uncharacterized protein n=1 Tax=Myroides odoratus TaxID=256 RepID=A0A378RJ88_MYROD|nr:O-antigen polymerase [Myroides odoratus]MCS4238346.1 hypothetical protein [Myroides odoratus]MDH6600847.1 hypothetical protein [Myroides gitamensis]QQU05445.1 oligosaccharide repeat unit polymerase [Myroides odoratus]STZ27035.1 Uncharacterised protein [Myroides odoratus]